MTRQSQASIEKQMAQSAMTHMRAGHLPFLYDYPDCAMHFVMYRNRYDNINWRQGSHGMVGKCVYHKELYLPPYWQKGYATNVGRLLTEIQRANGGSLRAHPSIGSVPRKEAASQWAAWLHGNPRAYAHAIRAAYMDSHVPAKASQTASKRSSGRS